MGDVDDDHASCALFASPWHMKSMNETDEERKGSEKENGKGPTKVEAQY